MDCMKYDNIEYMDIDDNDSISGQSARQVSSQKPVESVVEILQNIVNKDTTFKENLKRAVKIKESEREELLKQWNKAKESLDNSVKDAWFFEDQLNRNADELERMRRGMPFQKPAESVAEILEKIFINRDSILTENLGRALKNKKSEQEKLFERWEEAKKSLEYWVTETSFFGNQLNRNAEELEQMGGGMPFQKPVESVAEILEKIFINGDSILIENLGRALKNKKSEREELFEQWSEAKKSVDHWVTETWFFGNQLNRNAEELERVGGGMPFQKPVESVAETLEKIFINKDSIHTENLRKALKNKAESEKKKLLEQWKKAKESLVHWVSERSFFEYQLNRNAEELQRMRGTMQADWLGED